MASNDVNNRLKLDFSDQTSLKVDVVFFVPDFVIDSKTLDDVKFIEVFRGEYLSIRSEQFLFILKPLFFLEQLLQIEDTSVPDEDWNFDLSFSSGTGVFFGDFYLGTEYNQIPSY